MRGPRQGDAMRVFYYLEIWTLRSVVGTRKVPGICRWHRSASVARPPSSELCVPCSGTLFPSLPALGRNGASTSRRRPPASHVPTGGRRHQAVAGRRRLRLRAQTAPQGASTSRRKAAATGTVPGASTGRRRTPAPHDTRPLGPTPTKRSCCTFPALDLDGQTPGGGQRLRNMLV